MAASSIQSIAIVGSLVSYLVAVLLNAYFNIPGLNPFNATIGDLSHQYDTGITPTDPTFGIWGLIYFWLLALTIYCQTLLCRKSNGKPLFVDPGFLSAVFLVSFIISMLGNPLWIGVFLSEKLIAAASILICGVLILVVCLWSSVQRLDKCGSNMVKRGLNADIWCTRILIHNGVAIYLGWVCCATLIQVVTVAVYLYSVSMDAACFAALGILTAVVLAWFASETFLFDRQLRYVFGQYIAFLAALSGGYVKNYNPKVAYTQYSLGLLIVTAGLAAVKLVIIIVGSIKNPIFYKSAAKKL